MCRRRRGAREGRGRPLALRLLVAALIAGATGCSTFTSTRSRVVEETFVEAPAALASTAPVSDVVVPAALEVAGVVDEAGGAPVLLVRVVAERRLAYEAAVTRTPVRTVRKARAAYVIRDWPHDAIGQVPFLAALVIAPIVLCMDLGVPFYAQIVAFRRAGDGLDAGGGEPRDVLGDADGEACYVAVAESTEAGEPEPTEKRERIERTVRVPLPGAVVSAGFEGGPEGLAARAGPDGVARIPLADLAAVLPGRGAPVLVLESAGLRAAVPLADPAGRPILRALVRATLRPAASGKGGRP